MILLQRNHILFRFSAGLLIVACMLCVLFGYGTHLHINVTLDHIFDHGDIHANVHAHAHTHSHSSSSNSQTEQGQDQNHNHKAHDQDQIQGIHNEIGNTHSHTQTREDEHEHQHQHHTATVDLTGTLTQGVSISYSNQTKLFSTPAVLAGLFDAHTPLVWYLDLPPPDLVGNSDAFSTFSLRGPPLV